MRLFKKWLVSILLACLLVSAISLAPASAAAAAESQAALNYDVYLQLDGIEGEVAAKGYEKWIELTGVQFDAANQSSGTAGSGGGAGKAVVQPITVTKHLDASSIPLFVHTVTGKHLKSGKIVFISSGSGKASSPVLTIELSDVLISSYDFNNTNESVSLAFSKIQFAYSATDAKGGKTPPIKGGFDLKLNQPQ